MNKTIKSLITLSLMVISSHPCQAAVNLAAMTTGTPLPNYAAKQLMSGTLLYNPIILPKYDVTINSVLHLTTGAKLILCTVGQQTGRGAAEHYAVALDSRGMVADGALMWRDGDYHHLTIDLHDPYNELKYDPVDKVTYAIKGDTIETAHYYKFYSTTLGGNYFHKNGKILNRLVASPNGKFSQLKPQAIAVMEEGDANYLSPEHKEPSYSTVEGECDPMGMTVMMLFQAPASTLRSEADIMEFNTHVCEMADRIPLVQSFEPMSITDNNLLSYRSWCARAVLRNGYYTLPWIASHSKEECLSRILAAYIMNGNSYDRDWLEQQVKVLNDKKARKWWKKWIKENLSF